MASGEARGAEARRASPGFAGSARSGGSGGPGGLREALPTGGRGWLRLVPALVFAGVTGAHFYRQGLVALAPLPLAVLGVLLLRRRWAVRAVQALGLLGVAHWLWTLAALAAMRQRMGLGWSRLAAILLGVVGLGLLAIWLLDGARSRWRRSRGVSGAPLGAGAG